MRYFFLPVMCFLFFSCFHSLAEDQLSGFPYIQTLQTQQYGIRNENISAAQDDRGLIYLGTDQGIVQYDGHHWNHISSRANPVLTCGNDGIIYAGQYKEFGFLKETARDISFQSLTDSSRSIKNIHAMTRLDGKIFFASENTLYSYKTVEHPGLRRASQRKIKSFSGKISLYKAGQKLYVYVQGGSLYHLSGTGPKEVVGRKHLTSRVVGVLEHRNRTWVVLEDGQALFIRRSAPPVSRQLIPSEAGKYILTDAVLFGEKLALATRSEGLILMEMNRKNRQVLNEHTGLLHTHINRLFTDRDKNLWALHPNGVSIIKSSRALQVFNRQSGIEGVINQVTRFQGKLYLATSRGVYFLREKAHASGSVRPITTIFRKVTPVRSEAFSFYTAGNRLFAATRQGIFQLKGTQASLFYNKFSRQYTAVLPYNHQAEYLLIGLKNGLSVVRYVNGLFIHQGMVKDLEGHVLDITEDPRGNIWVNTRYKGLYRISPFTGFNSDLSCQRYRKKRIFSGQTKWVKPYALSNGMRFSTSEGLYRYNPETDNFSKDTSLDINSGENRIHPIAEADDQTLWVNTIGKGQPHTSTLYAFFSGKKRKTDRISLSLDPFNNFQIHTIHPEQDSLIWIGGHSKLLRLHIGEFLQQSDTPGILLHQVAVQGDSLIRHNFSGHQAKTDKPQLSYSHNTVRFRFSTPSYATTNPMLFRTRLEGRGGQWSDWANIHHREFERLREGDYTFEVQSKNGYGLVSPVLQYTFTIRPPFYRTWYAYTGYLLVALLIAYLIGRWRVYYFARERRRLEDIIRQRTRELKKEKEKSDRLIERMLPKDTAEELKAGVKTKPYFYNKITVLFGDIKGFTRITEEMGRGMLINRLSRCFLQFDHIVEKYNIEKIKTIGDAYMAAGGIPDESQTHPIEIILAGMEMQHYMHRMGNTHSGKVWDIRIGVDTGPVVAGVIGRNKLSYDIWGSTVNTASRMEALSEPGKINISGNTHALVKDFFICHHRGKMPVKHSGELDMYFVEGLRPAFTSEKQGLPPNENFHTNLQLLRLNDLEEVMLEKLENLPNTLYYHNLKHTVDVVTQAELIGKSEGVSNEQILLLKTAALFHDAGHLVSYDHHEEEGVKMARQMLPQYHYTPQQIEQVARLIIATKMPPNPSDLLEQIICDADLDYLGRADFVPVAYNLYKELKVRNKVKSFEHWKKIQIDFIRHHSYYTRTAQRLREVNKKRQLEKIAYDTPPR